MQGGTVTNIFAAGKGGDAAVTSAADHKVKPSTFGSLTGDVEILLGGDAAVTNIYASGEGFYKDGYTYDTTENAYLDGNVTITLEGNAKVKDSVYGGGKGIDKEGYAACARVESTSVVKLFVKGNATIAGNVYGGGENAGMEGNTYISLSENGCIKGNLYGGGKNGLVKGRAVVEIGGGIVEGSVYGGALGVTGQKLVYGGSAINMSGGWIKGNLYGGSELSDDGPEEGEPLDLIFVNLAGGTVSGNVFGGGYRGTVNGSTHLHIGLHAPEDCKYYQTHSNEKPEMKASVLKVDGSVYAGGDYGGGDTIDYTTITVKGTSHVYIDGTGYNTGGAQEGPEMGISGGVFGSGASCDAGSTRLVTLKNYGTAVRDDDGMAAGVTRTLEAIQRADRVVLNNSHVQLTGKSDVANPNQTTLYSLNRIGDHGAGEGVSEGENSLVLQAGSTLLLDSAVIETANFQSIDEGGIPVTLNSLKGTPNTILFDTGTVFRVSCTKAGADEEVYGAVSGYAYMFAGETADAYAYARIKTESQNNADGGFADKERKALAYENVTKEYRYWHVNGKQAVAARHAVLTAQTLQKDSGNLDSEGYAVAKGSVELPPAAEGSSYKITNVMIPTGSNLVLTDAVRAGADGSWITSGINNDPELTMDTEEAKKIIDAEKKRIKETPLTTFGLIMRVGSGFTDAENAKGKVISNASANDKDKNTIIEKTTAAATGGGTPHIDFYLTYWNEGITSSKSLGMLEIELTPSGDGAKITMYVEIITKASGLADQTVDLYATQSGSYTGSLVIPSGDSRSLRLSGVEKGSSPLVAAGNNSKLQAGEFSITMQPVKSQGWNSSGLLQEAFDLASYQSGNRAIGTTDSRYQAVIEFKLSNNPAFTSKEEADKIVLILEDDKGKAEITLNIHWKASIVRSIEAASGRAYNWSAKTGNADPVILSPKSALTAVIELGEETTSNGLWLELRRQDNNEMIALPVGTRLTLLGMKEFYSYEVLEKEGDNRLILSDFYKMWGEDKLSSNITKDIKLTFVVDFGAAANPLSAGSYNLRLRNETGADTESVNFTIQNSDPGIGWKESDAAMYAKGENTFTLDLLPNYDTRWQNGAAVVLSPESGSDFPEGTVFRYGNADYYPSGNKVYIPLNDTDPHTITMNTVNSAGMIPGPHELSAEIFPVGPNVGTTIKKTETVSYTVKENPSYGLTIELEETADRVVAAQQIITFTASYSLQNTDSSPQKINVSTLKKEKGDYNNAEDWPVEGNTDITDEKGTQTITVTVPENITAGTYRLYFIFGDQKVPYNLIVR